MKLTPAFLTLVMLGLVGLLVVGYVAKRMLAREEVMTGEERINIPMALTELVPGTVITEGHIGLGPIAASKMDREVLRTERVVVGRVVRNPIDPAQPIRTSDLYAIGERPPLQLSAGMRAVSVALGDGTSLVDGLIQPEQYVDVLFTPTAAADERGGMIMTLFKGVKVLAINRSQTSTPSLDRGNNNVTLEMTPEQSNILLLARQKGDINLTYNPNGLGDGGVAVADESRAYLDEILGLAPPQEPDAPFVTEIYYGAGRRANTFDATGRLDPGNEPPRSINSGNGTPDVEYPSPGNTRSPGNSGLGRRPPRLDERCGPQQQGLVSLSRAFRVLSDESTAGTALERSHLNDRSVQRLLRHHGPAERRGTIIPLLAFAILAVSAAGALVLDRLWIDAAQVQLQAAAEAASLAAASRMIDDDLLRSSSDSTQRLNAARTAADRIARSNVVCGHPVELDLQAEGDVRFGNYLSEPTTGARIFLETDVDPRTVIVNAQRLRQRSNALVLFFRGVTGRHHADAWAQAAATIDNRVCGIRPLPGSSVSGLPLGILETDPTGRRHDTWHEQIELGAGQDRYGIDPQSGALLSEPDGIPEVFLSVRSDEGPDNSANVRMLDLGTGLQQPMLKTQIADGIRSGDLAAWGGAAIFSAGPLAMNSSPSLVGECLSDLIAHVGRTRICFLYQEQSPNGVTRGNHVQVTRLVAVRILTLEHADDGPAWIVLQPSVIATRAAVLGDQTDSVENPYLYKLSLTPPPNS